MSIFIEISEFKITYAVNRRKLINDLLRKTVLSFIGKQYQLFPCLRHQRQDVGLAVAIKIAYNYASCTWLQLQHMLFLRITSIEPAKPAGMITKLADNNIVHSIAIQIARFACNRSCKGVKPFYAFCSRICRVDRVKTTCAFL